MRLMPGMVSVFVWIQVIQYPSTEKAIPKNSTNLLLSMSSQVCSDYDKGKMRDDIACDNRFILQTLDVIAGSDTAHMYMIWIV